MMKALYKHIAIKPDYSDDSFITIPEGRDYYNVLVFIRRSSILRNGATCENCCLKISGYMRIINMVKNNVHLYTI